MALRHSCCGACPRQFCSRGGQLASLKPLPQRDLHTRLVPADPATQVSRPLAKKCRGQAVNPRLGPAANPRLPARGIWACPSPGTSVNRHPAVSATRPRAT